MRQKTFPCCREPMSLEEVFELTLDDDMGSSSKSVHCPHCGKELTIYLNVDSVEVVEE